jgi:hypothetical protein
MRWLHKFLMQCQMLLGRDRAGKQLQAELQFHLDQQIAENLVAGMSPEEARRAALRGFGNPTTLRDQARNTWSWQGLELLLGDLRFCIRTLVRTPGFSVLAILVMGLGIGSNVALFTVVHSVLLKPLPFKDQDRLVRLYEADAKGAFQDNILAGGTFASWQAQAQSFVGMAIKKRVVYNLAGSAGQLPEVASRGQSHGRAQLGPVETPLRRRSRPHRQDHPSRRQAFHSHWSSSRLVHLSRPQGPAMDSHLPRAVSGSDAPAHRSQPRRRRPAQTRRHNRSGNGRAEHHSAANTAAVS